MWLKAASLGPEKSSVNYLDYVGIPYFPF